MLLSSYVMDVKPEYDIAKDLLYHLRELNRLREAISEMNRSLISEIHRYPTPPASVHQVMTAVFILLGEPPSQMKVGDRTPSNDGYDVFNKCEFSCVF